MYKLTPFQAANFADMAYTVKDGGRSAIERLQGHKGIRASTFFKKISTLDISLTLKH